MSGFNDANVWSDIGSGNSPSKSKDNVHYSVPNPFASDEYHPFGDKADSTDDAEAPNEEDDAKKGLENNSAPVNSSSPSTGFGDVDEFKIQNELAATMRSLAIDNKSGEPPEAVKEVESAEPTEPIVEQYETTPEPEKSDNSEYKRNKALLMESLTAGESSGLLSNTVPEPKTPSKSENLFESYSDDEKGPLDIIGMASDTSRTPQKTTVNDVQSPTQSINSPNKKKLFLRPRRANLTRRRQSSSPKKLESKEVPISSDPLTASQAKKPTNRTVNSATDKKKQEIIESMDQPLFSSDRSPAKDDAEESVTPSESASESAKSDVKFDITVENPTKVGELTNAHVMYTVTTHSSSPSLTNPVTEVQRRYRDFLWLYRQLMNNHPGYIIPPPPDKQIYGRFDDKFVESRRIALENMLGKISKRSVFNTDPDFIVFLQSTNFAEESMKRDHVICHNGVTATTTSEDAGSEGSNKSQDGDDGLSMAAVMKMSESSQNGGFFSSLMGLSAPKYVESDPYMLDKQAYIENLGTQLHSLSRSLDFILEKREELMKTQSELVKVVDGIADIEVNSEVMGLFSNFEDLEAKISQLLETTNLSQIMTIGATIDEYTRLIGSIRNCFENRFKICNSLVNLEYQEKKKQKQVAKARAKYQNQAEKIEKSQRELERLDAAIAKQTSFKDRFNSTFKKELDRFDFDKVTEFKNVIEIYWEGLIESQKELIELWESFYEKCGFDKQE